MKMHLEITEEEIKEILIKHLENHYNLDVLKIEHINIFVKSKQNYKSEWEKSAFKFVYDGNI